MAKVEMAALGSKGGDGPHPPIIPHIDDEGAKMSNLDRIKEKLLHALPESKSIDTGDLERLGWAHGLSIFYILLYAALLVYFVASGTVGEMAKKFLSLDAPSSDIATCESVPVAVTGTFYADRKGQWSNSKGYDKTSAVYRLDLTGTTARPEEYTKAMQQFAAQVQAVGARQAGYDIVSSLIAWGVFRTVPDIEVNMQFRPYSQIEKIFGGLYSYKPIISSEEGLCDTFEFANPVYTSSDNIFSTPIPPSTDSAAPTLKPTALRAPSPRPTKAASTATTSDDDATGYVSCFDQLGALMFGSGGAYSFDVDMRSVLMAFALNMGIIDVSALTVVYSQNRTIGSLRNVEWMDYVSDTYPDMEEVSCYRLLGKPRACFAYGLSTSTHVYPVITTNRDSGRATDDRPNSLCSCPQDILEYACNLGDDMQLALVFSKKAMGSKESWADTLIMGWKLQQMIADDPIHGPGKVKALVAGLAYTASFVRDKKLMNSWKSGKTTDIDSLPSYEAFAADFASLGNAMSIISYDLSILGELATINSQGVTLKSFATSKFNSSRFSLDGKRLAIAKNTCQDTLFQPDALQAMAAAPPISLVQPYYSCQATARSALVTAAGIAAGNASLISAVFLTLTLFLLVQYTNTYRKTHKVVPPARKALLKEQYDRAEMGALQAHIQLLQQENAVMRQQVAILPGLQQQVAFLLQGGVQVCRALVKAMLILACRLKAEFTGIIILTNFLSAPGGHGHADAHS